MPRLLPAGDAALLVDLGDDPAAEARVAGLDAALTAAAPTGVVEWIPGRTSLLVEWDPLTAAPDDVEAALRRLLDAPAPPGRPGRRWRVAVTVGGADGPDLAEVAARCGATVDEVVDALTATEHRVVMVGNLPGLPYLAGLPERFAVPRRHDPRQAVPAGSVALAAGLVCIYPVEGPGGWHLVGRTAARLFDVTADPPALLRPGDVVRLVLAEQAGGVALTLDEDGGRGTADARR